MAGASRKSVLKVFIKGILSIALLGFVFSFVPVREVVRALQNVDPGYAAAGFLVSPVMAWLRAVQIRILAAWQALTLTVGQIFRVGYIANFYGLFLPGILAGGAIRWYKFTRQDGKPIEALTIITTGRFAAVLVSVTLGFACWLADPVARQHAGFGVGLTGILFALLSLWLLWWHHETLRQSTARLGVWRRIPKRLRDVAGRVLDAAPNLRGLGYRNISVVAALSTCENLLGILSFWLFAQALGLDLAATSVAWVRTYIMLVLLLPISIGGFGVREGGLIVMLAAYGVSAELAVAYSFLLFARRLISAFLGGVFELWGVIWSPKAATGNRT